MEILSELTGQHRHAAVAKYAIEAGFKAIPFKQGLNYILMPTTETRKLILAHYDRVPNVPGANDNGAAIAELLTASLDWKPDSGTMIALVDLEEPSKHGMAVGSKALADQLAADKIKPEHVIVLDVCGIGDRLAFSSNRQPTRQLAQLIQDKASEIGYEMIPMSMPASDNLSFPGSALVIAAARNEGRQRHWSRIHTRNDNMESIQPQAIEMMQKFIKSLL